MAGLRGLIGCMKSYCTCVRQGVLPDVDHHRYGELLKLQREKHISLGHDIKAAPGHLFDFVVDTHCNKGAIVLTLTWWVRDPKLRYSGSQYGCVFYTYLLPSQWEKTLPTFLLSVRPQLRKSWVKSSLKLHRSYKRYVWSNMHSSNVYTVRTPWIVYWTTLWR